MCRCSTSSIKILYSNYYYVSGLFLRRSWSPALLWGSTSPVISLSASKRRSPGRIRLMTGCRGFYSSWMLHTLSAWKEPFRIFHMKTNTSPGLFQIPSPHSACSTVRRGQLSSFFLFTTSDKYTLKAVNSRQVGIWVNSSYDRSYAALVMLIRSLLKVPYLPWAIKYRKVVGWFWLNV